MTAKALLAALAVYAVWTLATWFFEGRVETLLRPEAAFDRVAYAVVANILVGIIGTLFVLAFLVRTGAGDARTSGVAPMRRVLVSIAIGFAAGFLYYVLQGGAIANPIVVLNAYAQVLVVSIAEVLVCWTLAGGAVAAVLRPSVWRFVAAALVASVLFGIYHFAHSPPFNTWPMVGLLTAVGLVTSLFFFVSRDLYGTIAFHNWLGTFGVAQALAAQGKLEALAEPQPLVLAMAVVALVALVAADRFLVRRT